MRKEIKVCWQCGMQYPQTRVRGCKCDGEVEELIRLVPGDGFDEEEIRLQAKGIAYGLGDVGND